MLQMRIYGFEIHSIEIILSICIILSIIQADKNISKYNTCTNMSHRASYIQYVKLYYALSIFLLSFVFVRIILRRAQRDKLKVYPLNKLIIN
jgi:hypothetical protein